MMLRIEWLVSQRKILCVADTQWVMCRSKDESALQSEQFVMDADTLIRNVVVFNALDH